MGIGSRSKTHKSPSVKVEYIIHIQEVKPWPPSQSLSTLRAALIQWEHGEKASGFTNQAVPSFGTGSGVGDGKIVFNESFGLRLTLMRELSVKLKSGDADTFQRNCIEFNLYEPRRDKGGQLLGTAVLDLAGCGVIKENVSISTPIICKRTYRNSPQPLLFLKIQPVEARYRSSTSTEGNRGESVSALMSEEYAEEAEVASSNGDDDDSSHSSFPVASSTADSNGSCSPLSKKLFQTKHQKDGEGIKENVASRKRDVKIQLNSEEITGDKIDHHLSYGFSQLLDEKKDSSTRAEIHEKYGEKEGPEVNNSLESGKSNGSTRRNHSLMTDTSRGSINSERKEVKASRKETKNLLSEGRVQNLERRLKILEEELREAAALEVSLYSVAAEHGSSMNKVHAPARRLSRLYLHANKQNPKSGRASASKSVLSGLILVSKACGNDVPRLTFWLSNTIILRTILSKSFGDDQLPNCVRHDNGKTHEKNGKNNSPPPWESLSSKVTRGANGESTGEKDKPLAFFAALENVEAWIFSRIVQSLWWQTFTPHMQSGEAKAIRKSISSDTRKSSRTSSSTEKQQGNFSLELWKKAFKDACERICPVRGGGHDCGCLPLLSKLIMEQLITRLDVAMFNAILRESAYEIPSDPVADPISDANVLPIPAGKASFGAGAQLKNAIGNWSRWLTDLFGMDDEEDDMHVNENSSETGGDKDLRSSKAFCLLNMLSDLMMLPKDLLLSPSIRKEVCPTFGLPLLRRIVNSFTQDEFCPDPIPGSVLEALNSEDCFDSEEDSIVNLPCEGAAIVYESPSADSVAGIMGGIGGGGPKLASKSQTSDDELEQLESPMKGILHEKFQCSSPKSSRVRYQLLRQVWKE